jgi:lipase
MAAATTLRTPLGRRVKVVEHGTGTPVVFLHSGVGSAGEWKQVFSLWPEGYRLVAIEAYRDGTGPGVAGRRSLDDYADQVYAVAEHVGVSVHLVDRPRPPHRDRALSAMRRPPSRARAFP